MQWDWTEGLLARLSLFHILFAITTCACVRIDETLCFVHLLLFIMLYVYLGLWRKDSVWSGHWKLRRELVKNAVFACVNVERRGGLFFEVGHGNVALDTESCAWGPEESREWNKCLFLRYQGDNLPEHTGVSMCVVVPRFVRGSGLCLAARAEWSPQFAGGTLLCI